MPAPKFSKYEVFQAVFPPLGDKLNLELLPLGGNMQIVHPVVDTSPACPEECMAEQAGWCKTPPLQSKKESEVLLGDFIFVLTLANVTL